MFCKGFQYILIGIQHLSILNMFSAVLFLALNDDIEVVAVILVV